MLPADEVERFEIAECRRKIATGIGPKSVENDRAFLNLWFAKSCERGIVLQ